ncbi:hypothetical protein BASA81_003652 [Batrachochytrium salamandrivorans]|nr:hypothetical protein BASA81_003652 [Batrachochytrium salamandrivorans]
MGNSKSWSETPPSPPAPAQDQNRLLIQVNNNASTNSLLGFRKLGSKPDLKERLLANRHTNEFPQVYEQKAELGSGVTGTVFLVTERRTQIDRAMKTFNLAQMKPSQLKELTREMQLLRGIDHPNIIKLLETFEGDKRVILIMDLCRGGTLVSAKGRARLRTEHAVKTVLHQLLQAIKFMHERGVVHRDIKLENIMFAGEQTDDLKVVLIDFGFSVMERSVSRFGSRKRLFSTNCGTAYYTAPEVLRGQYGKECDVWSIGVMAFILLTGSPPFQGKTQTEIYESIRANRADFTAKIWKQLHPSASLLVSNLLITDVNKRWTADQALASEWFESIHLPWSGEDLVLEQNIVQALERFANYTKLKKTAMLVLAHQCSGRELNALRNVFVALDSDNSGTISFPELQKLMVNQGMDEQEAHRLFVDADLDGSGGLQLTEFIAATMEATLTIDGQKLGEAFDRMANGEEFITVDHLRNLLGNTPQVREIILAADVNQDGKISREEFLLMVGEKHDHEVGSAFPELDQLY